MSDGRTRPSRALTPDALRAVLEEVVDELSARGVAARLTIYGGAALSLGHYERAATADVDATFSPTEDVLAVAAIVARRRDLPRDWINSAVAQFLPPVSDTEPEVVIERDGVIVAVGSARLLLAMKLRSSRPGRDGDDIAVLVRACGVTSLEDARSLVADIYLGEEEIPSRGITLIERALREVEIQLADGPRILPAVDRPR